MDYLDTQKEFRQHIILMIGYVLIAVAIAIATMVLVYQAYGFNLGKNGTVVQNGLVFFSSQPSPAGIYINGALRPETTNARLILQSGIYSVKLTRTGYRDWTRSITIDGGAVEHFDYPVLFPTKLTSQKIQDYASAPGLMTQSPDRRWLMVQKPGSTTDFDLYDLKNPAKPVATTLSIPVSIISKASASESWKLVAWADDNQHLLIDHVYDNNNEYILVDRVDPTQSVNLNDTLSLGQSTLTLSNTKYNTYYAFNSSTGDLDTASLSTNSVAPLLQHVLAYKSYGNNTVLYVTAEGAPKGKVLVKLSIGSQTYNIRSLPVSANYLIDLTTYSGVLYVAAGSTTDNRVYIYKDPVGQLSNAPNQATSPIWVLHVPQPTYLSFSDNAQFIVTEGESYFASYDIENDLGYLYDNTTKPIDPPQASASWMDGDRLTYVSNGKLIVQDYDNNNPQSLVSASSAYLPAYSSNYKYLFTLSSKPTNGQYELDETPLLTPSDL